MKDTLFPVDRICADILAIDAALVSGSQGKPCGHSFIAPGDKCHVGEVKPKWQPKPLKRDAEAEAMALRFSADEDRIVTGLNGVKFAVAKEAPDFGSIADVPGLDGGEIELKSESQHVGTGAVIVEPDGRVWVVEPKGGFGGYANTFPKGTLEDEGLTYQQNAHKEIFEETGLRVRMVGLLGDFAGDTSVTRYYVAKRTGGSPYHHRDDETAAVKLASPSVAFRLLNRERDKKVLRALDKPLRVVAKAAKPSERSERTRELAENVFKALPGAQRKWLAPLRPFFDGLVAKAADGELSDAQFIAAIEAASNRLAGVKLNTSAIEGLLESSMGAAMLNGALRLADKAVNVSARAVSEVSLTCPRIHDAALAEQAENIRALAVSGKLAELRAVSASGSPVLAGFKADAINAVRRAVSPAASVGTATDDYVEVSAAEGEGKPCGDSFIAPGDKCHVGEGDAGKKKPDAATASPELKALAAAKGFKLPAKGLVARKFSDDEKIEVGVWQKGDQWHTKLWNHADGTSKTEKSATGPTAFDKAEILFDKAVAEAKAKTQQAPAEDVAEARFKPDAKLEKWAKDSIQELEAMAAKGDVNGIEDAMKMFVTTQSSPWHKLVGDAWSDALKKAQTTASAKTSTVLQPGDTAGWEKTGGQKGSNPGGFYKGPGGLEYYVKTQKSEAHAKNEVLATKLYDLADVMTPFTKIVKHEGGLATAASKADIQPFNPHDKQQVALARKDFAAHAWIGNWDSVGLNFDNLVHFPTATGLKLGVVDSGGSLLFRAQGEPKGKAWNSFADEWETLRNEDHNPQAAKIFGGMTKAELHESAKRLESITDESIENFVKKYGPGTPEEKKTLAATLINRKHNILSKAGVTPLAMPESAPKPEPPPAPKQPPQPQPSGSPVFPEPPFVGGASLQSYTKKLLKIHGLAMKGDLAGLMAEPQYNPDQKAEPNAKIGKHHGALIAAVKAGWKPTAHDEKIFDGYKAKVAANLTAHGIALDKFGLTAGAAAAATPPPVVATPKPVEPPKPTVPAKPAKAKPVFDPAKLPSPPNFFSWEGTGKPLSGKTEFNTANQAEVEHLLKLAKPGVEGAVESYVVKSPSKWVTEYKNQLVAAIYEQLNPHTIEDAGATANVKELSAKFPAIAHTAKHLKWIGRYVVLGKADAPTAGKLNYATPTSHAELVKKSVAAFNGLKDATEKQHVKLYTGSYYNAWNSEMLTGTASEGAMKAANGVFKSAATLPAGLTLERNHGLDANAVEAMKKSVGYVIQQPTVVSTSTKKDWSWPGNVKLIIEVGEDVRGLFVGPGTNISSYSGESEVILPPNTRFQVIKHEGKVGGREVFRVRALPTEKAQCCEQMKGAKK